MATDKAENAPAAPPLQRDTTQTPTRASDEVERSTGSHDIDGEPTESKARKKRKRKWKNDSIQHGAKRKRGDMGRGEYFAKNLDKRERNQRQQEKLKKTLENGVPDNYVLPTGFTEEEIKAEDRKPKRKVAVMIGYSGSGYKGMQINTTEKTIEGDLFTAFVAAGAISKANADDPKKSQLVRCARTDKGVHAAGNVISLKLIIEDSDIVQKINSHLSPQIRVWGIQRTIGSFSCYQACDSRWYEYFIPTHCFLPPHPSSYLAKKLKQFAEEVGDLEGYNSRQEEVEGFWGEVEERDIKPILEKLDDDIMALVGKALHDQDDEQSPSENTPTPVDEPEAGDENRDSSNTGTLVGKKESEVKPGQVVDYSETMPANDVTTQPANLPEADSILRTAKLVDPAAPDRKKALDAAIRELRRAYIAAKKAYRIPKKRLDRIAEVFSLYEGTHNFHNYTIKKTFKDPSAKRHIKSFKISKDPIIIDNTEWLSLKVHGQSFMMHQIRKMVGMAALMVRCGTPMDRLRETFGPADLSIPKAPSLGLLLERPVFDTYNERAAEKFQKEKIDFTKYEKEMEEFKQREIYERMFREEEEGNHFHTFFSHLDNYKEPHFLFVTSKGIEATEGWKDTSLPKHQGKEALRAVEVDSDEDVDYAKGEDG